MYVAQFFSLIISQRDCAGRGQPFPYKLEHLMLLSIEVVSRSSIRPAFGLVTHPSA